MLNAVAFRNLLMILGGILWVGYCSAELVRADGARFLESFQVYSASSVVSDPDDKVNISGKVVALGDYKYSLDSSLASSNLRGMQLDPKRKVVKDLVTGRIGITQGRLIVKYADGVNGDNIALDYGLELVDRLPSINRIVVQLFDLTNLKQVQDNLMLDQRVLTTTLEAYYGGYHFR